MSLDLNKELIHLHFEESLETIRTIYTSTTTFMTFTVAAEAASLTIGIQFQNGVVLVLGGFFLIGLQLSLRAAGNTISTLIYNCFSLERELGISREFSIIESFISGLHYRNSKNLVEKCLSFVSPIENSDYRNMITKLEKIRRFNSTDWVKESIKTIHYFKGSLTNLTGIIGIIQSIIGLGLIFYQVTTIREFFTFFSEIIINEIFT